MKITKVVQELWVFFYQCRQVVVTEPITEGCVFLIGLIFKPFDMVLLTIIHQLILSHMQQGTDNLAIRELMLFR